MSKLNVIDECSMVTIGSGAKEYDVDDDDEDDDEEDDEDDDEEDDDDTTIYSDTFSMHDSRLVPSSSRLQS